MASIILQSSSKLGLSTITARLKLNYDATKALSEISSKVDQVRKDLPPEAEVPIINIESADTRFASAYLSFTSEILEANQITDYLVRVVQPRLAALEGVQRADILGGRTFAMRIWLKPDRLAAFGINPNEVRQALAANNFLSAIGRTKGSLVQVNLTANTDLRSVEEFQGSRRPAVRRHPGALARRRGRRAGRGGLRLRSALHRRNARCSWASGFCPMPTRSMSSSACAPRCSPSKRNCPRAWRGASLTTPPLTLMTPSSEVIKTLSETLLIVAIVIFLFLGSLRSVLDSAGGDSHFA